MPRLLGELRPGDRLRCSPPDRAITLLHPPGYDYFRLLRSKLHWGRGGDRTRALRPCCATCRSATSRSSRPSSSSSRPGLTVLTGETGAGKSILVDALELLAGGRAGAEWCAAAPSAPTSAPPSRSRHRPARCARLLEEQSIRAEG